jgi:hypothetical protein
MNDEVTDVETSINQISLLPVDVRDPGICHLDSPKTDVFSFPCLTHPLIPPSSLFKINLHRLCKNINAKNPFYRMAENGLSKE